MSPMIHWRTLRTLAGMLVAVLLVATTGPLPARGESAEPVPLVLDPALREQTALDWFVELYFGGLQIGAIDVAASWNQQGYEIDAILNTQGVIKYAIDSHYTTMSEGVFDQRKISPRLFISHYQSEEEDMSSLLLFDSLGPTSFKSDPPFNARYPVPEEQQRETLDPLSALLSVIVGTSADNEAPCGRHVPIFDGIYRYNILFDHVRDIRIRAKSDQPYEGPGYLCDMMVESVAGFPKPRRSGFSWPQMRVRMARIDNGNLVLPLRLSVRTDFGALVARVTRFDIGAGPTPSDQSSEILPSTD